MPKFFFHIVDGTTVIQDPDGSDLPDMDAARSEALQSARHLLADKVRAGHVINGQRFEIRDEAGNLLETVWFRDALRFP